MFDLPDIQPGDVVAFHPSALPDPSDNIKFMPCVTVIHNDKRITMAGEGGLSYVEALQQAKRAANVLNVKYTGVAHAY